ncbi:uncharacterized protein [Lepeophtheirus salmonis]|nr:actin-2-like [Lepeophtheirus salmonis]
MLDIRNLVVDLGTCTTKIGWCSDSEPHMMLPTIVGRGRHKGAMLNLGLKDRYVGRQAQNLRGILNLESPLKDGSVQNWDDVQVLWEYIRDRYLGEERSAHVLLTVPPLSPKEDWKKLGSILLESQGVAGVYLANKSALAMYGGGRTTGVCVDSGEDTTYIVPCLEGIPIPGATLVQRLGGKHVTDTLLKQLSNGKYSFIDDTFLLWKRNTSKNANHTAKNARLSVASRFEVVKEAKEKYCCVSPVPLKPGESKVEEKVLRLPDGNIVVVGEEALASPEILFTPHEGHESLHQLVYKSVQLCDESLRSRLMSNIALVGGNSLLPGMDERLSKELTALFPSNFPVRVQAQKGREFFSWEGGAHLSSLNSFQELWISRSDFLESGAIDNLLQQPIQLLNTTHSKNNSSNNNTNSNNNNAGDDINNNGMPMLSSEE